MKLSEVILIGTLVVMVAVVDFFVFYGSTSYIIEHFSNKSVECNCEE